MRGCSAASEFRRDAERLPIFGFGCGGGVAGLSRAARLARSMPGANVLFLTIDLCSLCLRIDDPSIEMFVSAALFGDGAVGVVLRGEPKGAESASGRIARIVATGEHLWRDTERIMGWDMKQDGFGVVLSPRAAFADAAIIWARRYRVSWTGMGCRSGISTATCSIPAGARCWRPRGRCSAAGENDLRHSWSVLRDYGNMSSATALFVLDEAISGRAGRHLLTAFGPVSPPISLSWSSRSPCVHPDRALIEHRNNPKTGFHFSVRCSSSALTQQSGQYSQGPGTQRKWSPSTATWQTDGNDR